MKQIDFAAINSALLATIDHYLAIWLPGGVREAHEYVALNPTRADKKRGSFRINMTTGRWSDFATDDAGGDLISLYAYLQGGKDQLWAAKELAPLVGLPHDGEAKKEKKLSKWEPVKQIPPGLEFKQPYHKSGTADATWIYRDLENNIIGAACRFNTTKVNPDTNAIIHGKDVFPVTWCQNIETGAQEWRFKGFIVPKPLYGLERLKFHPKASVLIVEGEKTADAAKAMFPNQVVMAWPGGGKGVKYVDFSPIAGRRVILWPDNDAPGVACMQEAAVMIGKLATDIRYVLNPEDAAEGWDLADSGWSSEEAKAYIKMHLVNELAKQSPAQGDNVLKFPDKGKSPPASKKSEDWRPFRALGFDRTSHYYMASGTRTIMALSLPQHNKAHLLGLAPLTYWEVEYPSRNGCNWDAAQDAILRLSESKGFFSPALIRGRGAWFDAGKVAVHLGDKVLYNKHEYEPDKMPGNYYYEAGLKMNADLKAPIKSEESVKFLRLMEMLPWEKPIDAYLMAGWCVCAHIGGALDWRPHVWMIGKKGSGKTHVMVHIIKPILGDNCLFIQSESTGAGIRQTLGRDALPVLFDEAEGEDVHAVARLQNILQLVRQSSSDTGGTIAKGTPMGKAQSFDIRSCFAFSSINATIIQSSDKSRVTVVEVSQDHQHISFEAILKAEADLLKPEYISSFYARALTLADVIKKNALVFAKVMAEVFSEQRAGDQVGTLLAGAYSLFSDEKIEFDEAKSWVEEQDWSERKADVAGMNDERALWDYLLSVKIRARVSGGAEDEFPIGYLIECARGKGYLKVDIATPESLKADDVLMRNGIKVEESCVYVSNTSQHIRRMLRETPWSTEWSRVLRRLPGAAPSGTPIYFGYSGSEARAVKIVF